MRHAYAIARATAQMPRSCEVRRPTTTNDPVQGVASSYATVATVPCLVDSSGNGPSENLVADEVRGRVPVTIHLPHGTDVLGTDRLRVDGAQEFEVVGNQVRGDQSASLAVFCLAI